MLHRIQSKAATAAWFLKQPAFWPHAVSLGIRKLSPNHDKPDQRAKAGAWASQQAVLAHSALSSVGFEDTGAIDAALAAWDEIDSSSSESAVAEVPLKLGGAGALRLLFGCVLLTEAERIVETGVAYGWSSFALLSALNRQGKGALASVDMPYPKMNNEQWVGCAVPPGLHERWRLIRQPDRYGIDVALKAVGTPIDLAHYDSDKSWQGRRFAYPRLWKALRPGGLLVSDDIQDNFFFKKFAEETGAPFAVIESQGKNVGLIRKQ